MLLVKENVKVNEGTKVKGNLKALIDLEIGFEVPMINEETQDVYMCKIENISPLDVKIIKKIEKETYEYVIYKKAFDLNNEEENKMDNLKSVIVEQTESKEVIMKGGAFVYDEETESFTFKFVGMSESEIADFYLQVGGIKDILNEDDDCEPSNSIFNILSNGFN